MQGWSVNGKAWCAVQGLWVEAWPSWLGLDWPDKPRPGAYGRSRRGRHGQVRFYWLGAVRHRGAATARLGVGWRGSHGLASCGWARLDGTLRQGWQGIDGLGSER